MNWYQDKKVVITGGSSGIGKATAALLAQWGAHVCICARDPERLQKACGEIKQSARSEEAKIVSIPMDVADRRQVRAAAPEAVRLLGGIDMLINSAGIAWAGEFRGIPDDIWDAMMQVDYMGTVNTVRAFAPYMIQQKSGSIVNVSSVLGYMGVFGYTAYSPAKFAVVGFSDAIRQELLPFNIAVSVVFPADVDTPQWHEENRTKPQETRVLAGTINVVQPEWIARKLLKGAAKKKFFIIPGLMNKFTYYMNRHLPGVVRLITTNMLRGYWKKNTATD